MTQTKEKSFIETLVIFIYIIERIRNTYSTLPLFALVKHRLPILRSLSY
jgi:hypothetical protein